MRDEQIAAIAEAVKTSPGMVKAVLDLSLIFFLLDILDYGEGETPLGRFTLRGNALSLLSTHPRVVELLTRPLTREDVVDFLLYAQHE